MPHQISTTQQAHAIRIGIAVGRVAVRRNWHPSLELLASLLHGHLQRRTYDTFVSRERARRAARCWACTAAIPAPLAHPARPALHHHL